jgi:hypothetical protein
MSASVILLEFNELCPSLMSRFISEGHLPNFKRFSDESAVYLTEAEERAPYLDPWIQWITVHTGLNFRQHGVERLNEGHTVSAKRVWDVVSEAGSPVWVCGSMNVGYRPGLKGALMPDPWTTHVKPTPDELNPFFYFVQRNVLEYTNERVPLTRADYLNFMKFMAQHGLSSTTMVATARQLFDELSSKNRWKRAVILDKLQFDVFQSLYRKIKPQFSTFFLNSTAHYQHFYWRNMEPEIFTVKPSEKESREYESAILFGYQEMDRLLGRMMALAGKEATLVFSTAMSQQPYLGYEDGGGRHFYRPSDFDAFLKFAGVPAPFKVAPVMAHQFHVYCSTEDAAIQAEQRLRALTVDGRTAMAVERSGLQVFCGCHLYQTLPKTVQLVCGDGRSADFYKFFYQVEGMKSGMHHPDGMLWIRRPDRVHSSHAEKVPLAAVAPTLLDLLGLPKPDSMTESSILGPAAREPAHQYASR